MSVFFDNRSVIDVAWRRDCLTKLMLVGCFWDFTREVIVMSLLSALRRPGTRTAVRARRHCRPEVALLEGRALLSMPGTAMVPMTAAILNGVAGQNGYFRSPVTVTLVASDPGVPANMLSTFYRVNAGPYVAGHTVLLNHDGAFTVSYFSTAPGGKVESPHTLVVRIDETPPVITAFASPTTLWPPNGKLDPVTVTGHVTDNFSGVAPTVSYHVVDEYGQVQPSGIAMVNSKGNYSFVVYPVLGWLGARQERLILLPT